MKVIGNILWAVLKRVRLFTDSTLGRADLALVAWRLNNVVVYSDASHHRRGAAAHRFAT
jgi:hypothetical protein